MTPIAPSVSPAPVTFGGAISPLLRGTPHNYSAVRAGLETFQAKHPAMEQPVLKAVWQLPQARLSELGLVTETQIKDAQNRRMVLLVGNPGKPATQAEKRHLEQLVHETAKHSRDTSGLSYPAAKQALFVQA